MEGRPRSWGWFQEFFARTLDLMAPSHVLALGLEPIRFLETEWAGVKRFADLSRPVVTDRRSFTAVALLHPSAHPADRQRLGRSVECEAALVRRALSGGSAEHGPRRAVHPE